MSDMKLWKTGVNFAGREIIGERSGQEDYSLFRLIKGGSELLVVLSDGMGGHTAGEIASKNAVTIFDSTFNSYPSDSIPTKLGASLQQANNEISRLISGNSSLDGMGCTLIGAHLSPEGLRWISVGDSLIYLYRDGKLIQLNADHSMAPLIEESLKAGKISKDEAQNHPNKNALRSAVMGLDIPLIDAPKFPTTIYCGDIIIVASDGILTLSSDQIINVLSKHKEQSADEISTALVRAVESKKRPRQDNTTIQILVVPESFKKQNKLLKKLSVLLILFVSLIALTFLAYFFDAPKLALRLANGTQGDEKIAPQPIPVPPPIAESSPSTQAAPLPKAAAEESHSSKNDSSKENKKSSADAKKPPSTKNEPGNPKALPKSQYKPGDGALVPQDNSDSAASNAGLGSAASIDEKSSVVKPKSPSPAKGITQPEKEPPATIKTTPDVGGGA